ncbi:hypothetical protein GCM10011487_26170 [Steroidobacter agaridevorans]|uniref:Uncharacterized protein n=1 Tax=Steroidobacter agaridevorans TaxID=2695856 RepID=A0A829YBE5_9GAMM|nr:hypothetical protein [Steroidobacter agaridevorans]GFE80617.1 hypothetical protein GCM10011487_26170 [Steroidobacter agaridevorans]GFE87671.1 hypothetical protein GCM10011488_26250 [Steroidobacter agaridevorans]
MSEKDPEIVQAAGLMFFLFVAASTVLSLLLPNSAESYPPAMTMLADLVAAAVPSIDGFVSVSEFPVATKMFLAVQWLLVPGIAALISRYPALIKPNQRTLQRFSRFKVCLLLIAVAVFFVIFPATMSVQPEDLVNSAGRSARTIAHVSESRLWMGSIGSMVIFLAGLCIALVIGYVRVLFFGPPLQRE